MIGLFGNPLAQMGAGMGFVTGKAVGGTDPGAPPPPPEGYALPGQPMMFPNDPATQLRNVADIIPQGGVTALVMPHFGPSDDWDAGGLREAWDQLRSFHWNDPGAWLEGLWVVVKDAGGYVLWNYTDFVRQWQLWGAGTHELAGIFRPLWRTLVTVVMTWGIVEIATVVETLWDVLRLIWQVLTRLFAMTEDVASLLWNILVRIGDSVLMVWSRVFG